MQNSIFYPVFSLFYNFINNSIVEFTYKDDVTLTWFFPGNIWYVIFSDKKNSNSNFFAMWIFVPLKCWKDFAAGMGFDTL